MALCSAAAAPVLAQTQVINSARVTVPVGVVDTNPDNNEASATVRVVVPNLSIAKSGPATAVVGTAYNYVVTLTNNGTAPTTAAATVTDTVPAGLTINSATGCSISGQTVTCTVAAGLSNVAPGNTASFTINVTPTASAASSVSNTAVVTGGGDPDCVGTGCTTPPVVTTVTAPNLVIAKSGPATAVVGTAYNYVVTLTNNGTAPTTAAATVTDTVPAGLTINSATGCSISGQTVTCTVAAGLSNVAPGNTASFTINVTPTASAASSVSNTAVVTGGGDPDCVGTGCTTPPVVTTVTAPNLVIAKSGPATAVVGTAYNYVVTLTNNGTAPTTAAATVTDTVPAGLTINSATGCSISGQTVTCTVAAGLSNVAPGNTRSFTINVTPTASAASSVSNTAVVTGGGDPDCVGTGCTTPPVVTTVTAPNLVIAKSGPATAVVGTAYNYVVTLTNNGTAPTTAAATVTDTVPAGLTINSATGCSISGQTVTCTVAAGLSNVAPGNTRSFTINVTPTASAASSVSNTAVVTGGGDPDCVGTGCTTPPVVTTVRPTIDAVNDSYNVPAAGGTTASVIANDTTNNVAAVIGTNVTLAPGAAPVPAVGSITMNANGTITVVANTAAGSYSYPYQICTIPATVPVTCDSAVATVVIASAPGLTIVKTAGTPTGSTAGSTIAYSFLVTNTGNVTITGIVVNDAQLDAAAVCPVTTLAPGEDTTCTGTHTITQAEVNAGVVNNSATATGTPPTGPSVTSPPDTTSTPIASAPGLTIVKTAGTPTGSTAGSTIAYSFLVTNTGNVTITGIVVNDAQLDAAAVCPVTTLAPGEDTTCTGTHTITQAEVNAGVVNNSATATGTPPTGPSVTSPPDTTSTPIASAPGLTIVKTAGTPTGSTAGSTIAYSFLVTNTGNVTITGIVVNDAQLDAAAVCPVTTLAPGEDTTCTGTHTITQAEVNAGVVNNSATATGTPPTGPSVTSPPDTTSTPIASAPGLTIVKTAGTPTGSTAGSTIAYSFLVTNTGNVTITGIVVNDAQLDAAAVCPVTTLAPGEDTTCTGTHTITQAEVNAGVVNNSATATGTPPTGPSVTSPPDTTSTPIASAPGLTIVKTAGTPTGSTAGSTIAYSFLVTNTGNVTITGIVVNDAQLDAAAVCPVTTLAPGEDTTCTGTHTITQAEVNAGVVNNSATATGTPPTGPSVTSPPDTTSTPIASAPGLTIVKTAGTPTGSTAGSTIAYSFLVTNTGNVTITGIVVNDAQLDAAAVCPVTTLAPGEDTTCTGTHTITQAEVNAGVVNNSATATGTPPTGPSVTSPPDTTSTPIASAPGLTIVKTAGTPTGSTAGSTIAYSFLVTNTGNVTITGIVVNDAQLDAAAVCPVTTLAPGEDTTCTGTHTITQAEVNAGVVNNSATATGTPPTGPSVTSPPDTTSTPIASAPGLTIVKTAGTPTGSTAGSTIAYSFLVTNTGNVTITGIVVNDAQLDAAAVCPVTTLAPGEDTTCTGTHTITQAEVNAGVVNNSATATGTPPTGPSVTSPPDTTSTPIASAPGLTIVKTAGTPTGSTAGSTIAYSFLVTNTGNVTITGIVVNDAQLDAAAVCPVTTLAPGEDTTCTGTHTITQAEVNAGVVNNSATATGTPPTGPSVTSPPDTTSTPIASAPGLTIVKTAGTPTGSTAGSTIAYSFLVTNTGNVTITGIVVNDAQLDAAAVCPVTTLAPGEDTTCTGTHTITQAEVNAGVVNNSATATGTPPTGPSVTSPPDTTSTPIASAPGLTIVKTAGTPTGSTAGSTIAYSFLVTNTGNVTITGIVVNDAQLDAAAVCPVTTLAPGEDTTCTGTHTITQAEVNAGVVNNSATATGTPPTGPSVTSPPDTTSTPIASAPGLTIVKTAGTPTGSTAGSTIAYSFLVTNTGNVTITGIVVNDAQLDAAAVCPVTTLAPGEDTTCTGTHTITQAEVNAGVVNNSATATGTPPTGPSVTSPPDTTSTPIASAPGLTIVKTAGTPTGSTAGSTIAYSFLVTNTGNVTITGIVVNDAQLDAAAVCPVTTLAPGEDTTCTGTHTITQAEVNAGVVNNSATATGTPPTGPSVTSPPDTTSTPIASAPGLTIVKTAGTPTGSTAGSTIAYSFLVTNTGNVTITGIVVNDAQLDAAAVCPVTTLAPGEDTTCTGTHTITQAEVNAGVVNNSATATGTPPTGPSVTSPPDTTSTPIASAPGLTIVKTAGTPTGSTAGSTIAYSFLVTNTGNVTITGIVVNDAQLDAAAVCPVTTLAPGEDTTCTGTHTITQAEVNAGVVNNSATATGTPPTGPSVTSPPDTTSTPIASAPGLTIVKTAGTPTGSTAGSTIAYSFLVTNTGNVTITGIVVNDAQLDAAAVCPVTTLAPGEDTTCTGTHTITQAEVNAGVVNNSATATGTPPTGPSVTSPPDTTSTPIASAPGLTIVKTAGTPTGSTAGSTIAYSFLVTNTGNVTITGIVVNDAQLDAAAVCPVTTLAPGEDTTCTGTHTITQAEVNAGVVNNSATATGTPPTGPSVTSPPDTTSTPIASAPGLTIVKTAGTPTGSTAGSTIAYSFLVTNTGNVTITGIVVNDAQLDAAAVCPVTTLAPGEDTTCTGTHTITQAEVNAGVVNNSATATGTPPTGPSVTSPPDTTSTPIASAPGLTIVKTAGTPTGSTAGSTIAYSFLVTNTGNVTITGIVVNDAQLDAAAVCPVTTLAPGEDTTCTGTHTITQAEVNAGVVNNSATATGTPPTGPSVTSPPDTTSTPIASAPGLTIVKTAGTPTGSTAGSTIAYSFLVTNTGNVTITGIVVNDAQLDAAAVCPVTTLAPGEDTTCTGTHTITQAEVNAGVVNNSATATGTPPTGPSVTSPPDTTSTPIASAPGLTIVKTAGTPTGSTAGSTIAYSFLVTNTGNVTITGIVVNDAQLDAAAVCPVTTLAPGEDTTCTGTHTITQAEVNAGVVNNSATATGTPPTGPSVTSPPDTTSTPIASAPGLTIVKTAGTPTGSTAGSTIAYSFLVTNTGNVTITGIVVNDAQLDAAAVCPVTTLAPGEDTTCTGTHTITQAEVNAGVVNNSATATGTPPTGPSVTSPPDTTSTPIASAPGQSLVKALTGDSTGGAVAVGDELTYTITLSNTGNTTLTGVVVNDALITPSSISCASVAPGATCQLVGTYTVTQADADAGNIRNTAVVSSPACPAGSTNAGCTTTIDTPVPQTPGQSLVKALTGDSTGGAVAVGDELTYTITLSNTGNTTLTGVVVNDALITPSSISCASVAPGATCQLVGTYTVTQADADAGNIRNTAVVSSPACPAGSTNAGCTTTIDTPVQNPAVTFSKSVVLPVGQTEVSVGDTLTYNLQVVVGDAATTSPVTLTDTLGQGLTLGTVTAGSLSCGVGNPLVCTLPANTAPGTYLVTYTAIVNELATGFVRNVVVATGDDAPTCQGACQTETIVTEPLPAIVSYGKSAVLPAGKNRVVAGDVITYTLTATVAAAPTSSVITLTDTLGTGLTFGAVTAAGAYTCGATSPLVCTLPEGTVPGVYTVTYTATVNGQASGVVRNAVVGTGTDNPVCANECDVETPVATPTVVVNKSSDPANGATVQPGQVITYTLSVQVGQAALDSAVTLVDTPDRGLTLGAMPAGCAYNGTTMTCIVPAGTPVGTQTFTYTATVNASVTGRVTNVVVANSADPTDPPPTCQTCSTEHLVGLPEIRLSKSAGVREVRIGDLVRYTLTVENVGSTDLVNGSIVDTPAAGFSYVEGSLLAADADRMVTVSGNRPLRFAGVDVRAGETATLVYVLRVGAGVRPGAHVNQAQVRSSIDEPVSNVATAEVLLTADAMLDDSLLVGTVFNDRDGDGWQDSATLGGVKVQGGFAPGAYIANSTTVDHGAGPQPEPDASSPMLHGIAVGTISGRQSPADPVDAHEVVIRQRLSELAFTDDFVLTSDQGVTVRMDAAGNTRVEQSGDAAKGLTAAAPTVERRVAQGEGGYVVDYVIRNTGIDERGIPGVRIASVEGLLIETDQYGRYHLAGVSGGAWERGRNFILKVDPSTLPSGAEFTTDNPLLRRITPGVPVRFDFGVKLPEQVIEGGSEQVELELGEVFFAPGSAEVRAQYRPVIEAMAAQVRKHGGGEVVISANGDAEALAFERANAVKAALLETLEPAVAQALVVSARGNVDDPGSLVVGVDEGGALLGTVLFDTDKAAIRPEFEPLLDKVAAALEKRGGGSIAIVGHTDVRGSHAYNTALGMRRAKAVYEALAKRLSPEVRAHVRVESSNDPTAPVGVRK